MPAAADGVEYFALGVELQLFAWAFVLGEGKSDLFGWRSSNVVIVRPKVPIVAEKAFSALLDVVVEDLSLQYLSSHIMLVEIVLNAILFDEFLPIDSDRRHWLYWWVLIMAVPTQILLLDEVAIGRAFANDFNDRTILLSTQWTR